MWSFKLPLVRSEQSGDGFPPEAYTLYLNESDGAIVISPKHEDNKLHIERLCVVQELAEWKLPPPGVLTKPRVIELGQFGSEFERMDYYFSVLHYNCLTLTVVLANTDTYWVAHYGNEELIDLIYPEIEDML